MQVEINTGGGYRWMTQIGVDTGGGYRWKI